MADEPVTPAPADPATPEPAAPAATTPPKTFTEAEHKAAVAAAVQDRFKNYPTADELKALREAAKKAEELETAQMTETDKAKSDAEKARKEAEDAKAALAKAQRDILAAKVGRELGLPEALIDRLHGDDETALKADAATLLAALPKGATPGGTNPGAPDAPTLQAQYDDAVKRGDSVAALAIYQQMQGATS